MGLQVGLEVGLEVGLFLGDLCLVRDCGKASTDIYSAYVCDRAALHTLAQDKKNWKLAVQRL